MCGRKRERETRERERERETEAPSDRPKHLTFKMIDFGFPKQLISFTKYIIYQNNHRISVPDRVSCTHDTDTAIAFG